MNAKSSSQPISVAIDTCLIIGLFFDEDPELSESTEQLFEDSRFQVYIPTLVGVETIGTPSMRLGAQTPPISNEKIGLAKKFLDGCGAFWIELDVRAMKRAQKLATEFMIRPADACVVACAIEAGCKYLFTKDDKLITSAQSLQEIKVTKPVVEGQGSLFPIPH